MRSGNLVIGFLVSFLLSMGFYGCDDRSPIEADVKETALAVDEGTGEAVEEVIDEPVEELSAEDAE